MPQLDLPMFTDQIFFMSIIFYFGHIYTNEVILPNVSALKQYRQIKFNSLLNKIKTSSFFLFSCNKNQYNVLRSNFFSLNTELTNFNYMLIFLLSFNYKFIRESSKNRFFFNFLVAKKIFN
jgi:hypothetical protein